MMRQNLEDNGSQLAFGQTVQAIEGESKVERITDKASYDDMVVCVGFRPNTGLVLAN